MTVYLDRVALQRLVEGAVMLAGLHKQDADEIGVIARSVLSLFDPDSGIDLHSDHDTPQ